MKKQHRTKLSLARETIRQLDASLTGVAGALPPQTRSLCATECTPTANCPTNTCGIVCGTLPTVRC